jgi:hypothetical protein
MQHTHTSIQLKEPDLTWPDCDPSIRYSALPYPYPDRCTSPTIPFPSGYPMLPYLTRHFPTLPYPTQSYTILPYAIQSLSISNNMQLSMYNTLPLYLYRWKQLVRLRIEATFLYAMRRVHIDSSHRVVFKLFCLKFCEMFTLHTQITSYKKSFIISNRKIIVCTHIFNENRRSLILPTIKTLFVYTAWPTFIN